MITFEEQFPNLKGMGFGTRSEIVNKRLVYVRTFSSIDIQEYCLDKQKVRDAIKRIEIGILTGGFNMAKDYSLSRAKKELGL